MTSCLPTAPAEVSIPECRAQCECKDHLLIYCGLGPKMSGDDVHHHPLHRVGAGLPFGGHVRAACVRLIVVSAWMPLASSPIQILMPASKNVCTPALISLSWSCWRTLSRSAMADQILQA